MTFAHSVFTGNKDKDYRKCKITFKADGIMASKNDNINLKGTQDIILDYTLDLVMNRGFLPQTSR